MGQADTLAVFGPGEVLDSWEVARRCQTTRNTALKNLRKLRAFGEVEVVGLDHSRVGPDSVGGGPRFLYKLKEPKEPKSI